MEANLSRMIPAASAGARLVAIVCAAQVFVQLGAGYWPVLLPELMGRWSLSNSEAGWITSGWPLGPPAISSQVAARFSPAPEALQQMALGSATSRP